MAERPEAPRYLAVRGKKYFVEKCEFLEGMEILAGADKYASERAAHCWEGYLTLEKHSKKARFHDATDKNGNVTVKGHSPSIKGRGDSLQS
ncbi:MAG: hypothetical protein JKX76_03110 [Colwellia sp.]|nr:hypothetical protein [Colwellia sp.]